jgi:hypothetical protein
MLHNFANPFPVIISSLWTALKPVIVGTRANYMLFNVCWEVVTLYFWCAPDQITHFLIWSKDCFLI